MLDWPTHSRHTCLSLPHSPTFRTWQQLLQSLPRLETVGFAYEQLHHCTDTYRIYCTSLRNTNQWHNLSQKCEQVFGQPRFELNHEHDYSCSSLRNKATAKLLHLLQILTYSQQSVRLYCPNTSQQRGVLFHHPQRNDLPHSLAFQNLHLMDQPPSPAFQELHLVGYQLHYVSRSVVVSIFSIGLRELQ